MKFAIDLPERIPGKGFPDWWDKDDAITVEVTAIGSVRIHANKAGLYSLARLLLVLAQDTVPTPYFVAIRGALTPESVGLTVRKIANEEGVMSRQEIKRRTSTQRRKRVEDYRELIGEYLAGDITAREFKRNWLYWMNYKVEPQVNEEPFVSIKRAIFATVKRFDPTNFADEASSHRINEQELRAEMERLLARLDEAIAAQAHKDSEN